MGRPTPQLEETGPERTCIVTRAKAAPEGLLRFVVGPDGAVVPDLRGRLPGRGAWMTTSAAVAERAVRRKAFARAFKQGVAVSPSLPADIDTLLAADAIAALAMANKAGLVLAGSFKVETGLKTQAIAALLHAVEASPDGVRKLEAVARRPWPGGGGAPLTLQIFETAQLDLALGRANVIHAALLVGGASEAFLIKAARLHAYRVTGLPQQAGPSTELPDEAGAETIRTAGGPEGTAPETATKAGPSPVGTDDE